jgi:ABC-type branched-subunit amino acid transport system substrate-binding protein
MGVRKFKMRSLCSAFLLTVLFCISAHAQNYTLSKKDTSDIQYLDGKKYYILKVDKNETLYSISKRFNVSQDELVKINPWIKDGLKVNKKVWIPGAGGSAKKEKGKDESEKEKVLVKQTYHVGLFLPLNLSKINYDVVPIDSSEALDKETLSNLQFYEGINHAVDTLAAKDCRIHLSVFDTSNDSLTAALLLKEWRLKDIDFMISQNNTKLQKMVNKYSMEHHIPLFTFYLNATDVIKDNPYAYSLQPSSNLQCKEAGKFAAERFKNANVIAVKTTAKENERAAAFQSGWQGATSELKPKIIDFASLDSNLILKALVKGKNNVVFVASSNEDVVNPLLLTLIGHKEEYEYTVIGLPTWQYFESIDIEVLETLNTHIFSAYRHNQAELANFRNYFRREFLIEPLDAAFQGYDLMMLIGKNFMGKKQPEKKDYNGIFSNYTFPDSKGVHENNFITMLKYRNSDLVEVR